MLIPDQVPHYELPTVIEVRVVDRRASAEEELVERAAEALAGWLTVEAGREINPHDLRLKSFELVTWEDGSLGAPQPGIVYTQACVPGFKMVFLQGCRAFCVHGDWNGQLVSPDFPQ